MPSTLGSCGDITPTPNPPFLLPNPTQLPSIRRCTHPITRFQNNIFKPKQFHTTTKNPLHGPLKPLNPTIALCDPNWRATMIDELNALTINETWELVPPYPSQNIIGYKQAFRVK